MRRCLLIAAHAAVAACSQPGADVAGMPDASSLPARDGSATATCADVTETGITIAAATGADEYVLAFTASSASATSWGAAGNEALILEVSGATRGFIGHLILHQGAAPFGYTMDLGALAAGEAVAIRVSALSAVQATKRASVCGAWITAASGLPDAEGIAHAPIYRWPVAKRFNDVPVVVGWSKARKGYQGYMTNEDGGTAALCGGGAAGMQAEIARWGRSTDLELHYSYGGAAPTWERCTGSVPVTTTPLRGEADHPILYYGDGHNRLFESRGGYGQTCGSATPEQPDGDIAGWSSANPSNALAADDGKVIVLRPVPFELDALGYAQFGGRREAVADRYAPWLYRIASLELAREGKIDNALTLPMSRYLYVDIRVADVGGTGDSYCTRPASGGFVLRAVTTTGTVISSPQITAAYASNGNHDWKRIAIALPANLVASEIDHFVFDAYDGDGIYLTALGDAFIPGEVGDNGATLSYVRQGTTDLAFYIDDNSNGCIAGVNHAGPGGLAYSCAGSLVTIAK